MTEAEQIEAKIGQVAYQIATNSTLRIAAEDKIRELSATMRELTKKYHALTAPKAQEHTDGEG